MALALWADLPAALDTPCVNRVKRMVAGKYPSLLADGSGASQGIRAACDPAGENAASSSSGMANDSH